MTRSALILDAIRIRLRFLQRGRIESDFFETLLADTDEEVILRRGDHRLVALSAQLLQVGAGLFRRIVRKGLGEIGILFDAHDETRAVDNRGQGDSSVSGSHV